MLAAAKLYNKTTKLKFDIDEWTERFRIIKGNMGPSEGFDVK